MNTNMNSVRFLPHRRLSDKKEREHINLFLGRKLKTFMINSTEIISCPAGSKCVAPLTIVRGPLEV